MKITGYFMVSLFLLAAALQFNDPDPIGWAIVYGATSCITALFLLQRINWYVTATASVLAAVASIFIGVDAMQEAGLIASSLDSWRMQNMAVEKAREAGGLLIVALWMFVMSLTMRKKGSASD